MNEIILELHKVSAGYGQEPVIREIDLVLRSAQILGIVGESGSGKSTLLKTILPAVKDQSLLIDGQVIWKGKELSCYTGRERRRIAGAEIGMVFQNPEYAFNPVRSYYRQFAETLKSHGRWDGKHSVTQILELFRRLNLPDYRKFLDRCPCEMSGGMNQRISIALAALLNPQLLLADEPTSALDVMVQKQVIEQLKEIREIQQTAMIIVTHNMGVAAAVCDDIAVIRNGRLR